MLVYHGSNHNFRNFRISKSLVERQSSLENEGIGIYFSSDRETAKGYGKYLYSFYINDNILLDFRLRATCRKWLDGLIEEVRSKTKVNLRDYLNTERIVSWMQSGGYCLYNMNRNLYLELDNIELWYTGVTETTRQRTYSIMRAYTKRTLVAYFFQYHVRNIGVVKRIDDNIVQIVNKELSYL